MMMPKDMMERDQHFIDVISAVKFDYLTAKQTADALSVPVRKIQEMARQGELSRMALVTEGASGRRDVMILKTKLWRWYFADGIPGVTMPKEV